MIRTRGLTHVALGVEDAARAFAFYHAVFGMEQVYRGDGFIQAQTPGSWDVLVFEEDREGPRGSGGIRHFGFRLLDPADVHAAADAVRRAGGKIREQGEFVPGEPYLFCTDPDGYEVEIWYELPTPVDPVRFLAIDHVQLAMPAGGEDHARAFYAGVLRLAEMPKPAVLAVRGGAWFEAGEVRVHLGVESDFRPAKKAHPAIAVDDLAALRRALEAGGCPVKEGETLESGARLFTEDPFGNRLEFLERR